MKIRIGAGTWGAATVFALAIGLSAKPALGAVDACDHDRPKYCGNVTSGDGRIHNCMMEKLAQLTPACQGTVKKADELYQSMETRCKDDIQRFCSQYSPMGLSRVVQCLREHRAEVTPPCRKAFEDYKALGYRVRE